MKLLYRIIIRLFICLSVILAGWAVFFYFAIIEEVNDETDDMLEDYSEHIMIRALAGKTLPSTDNGSNNQYFLNEVSSEYADRVDNMRFYDSLVYAPYRREIEPARILATIFRDKEGKYYELKVTTPTIEKDDLREAILSWMIFLYVTLLLIIIAINILIYKKSTKPLYVILAWLDSYRVGAKNKSLENETKIKEFQKLNRSLSDSMNRAEVAYEKQKQFIGNASHEIQTPIAICLNRIELMMDDDNLSESQLQELAKTHDTLQYITKLNKSLLLLSKIDNKQFIEKEHVNCNVLIKKLAIDYQEVYAYQNIDFRLIENNVLYLDMNETLAAILFNNLIKNSFLHNTTGGSISIEINTKSIVFKNTGDTVQLNPDQIFDRFYQGSKKKESTGLGLAIVKAICDIENLKIQYQSKANMHSFIVTPNS